PGKRERRRAMVDAFAEPGNCLGDTVLGLALQSQEGDTGGLDMGTDELAEDVGVAVVETAAGKLAIEEHGDAFAGGGGVCTAGGLEGVDGKRRGLDPGMSLLGV